MNKKIPKAQEEMNVLNRKIERLNKNIVKARRVCTIFAVIGAVITTIFSVINMLEPAVISFAGTVIVVFSIDLVEKILTVVLVLLKKRHFNSDNPQ